MAWNWEGNGSYVGFRVAWAGEMISGWILPRHSVCIHDILKISLIINSYPKVKEVRNDSSLEPSQRHVLQAITHF